MLELIKFNNGEAEKAMEKLKGNIEQMKKDFTRKIKYITLMQEGKNLKNTTKNQITYQKYVQGF